MPYIRQASAKWNPRATYRKNNPAKKPARKYPLALKNGQTRYELGQPTARSYRTAMQTQLTQTPIWPITKLIHNQMYYDFGQTLAGASGVLAQRVYSASGAFDPDITGTGHQIIGFDQLMAAYEHYSVIRAKITLTFMNNGQAPARVGVYLNPDPTPTAGVETIMENGLCKSVACDCKGTAGTGQRIYTVSLDCDLKKYFGKGKYSELLEQGYQGSVAANPNEQVYFTVFAYDPFGATTTAVSYDALISYDVIYTEPRKLVTS